MTSFVVNGMVFIEYFTATWRKKKTQHTTQHVTQLVIYVSIAPDRLESGSPILVGRRVSKRIAC